MTPPLRFVLNSDARIWHADSLRTPGAAGAIAFDLYGGRGQIEAVVDRIDPQRLIAIDIHAFNGLFDDAEVQLALRRVLGANPANRFIRAAASGHSEVEVAVHRAGLREVLAVHGRLPRILDEIAAVDGDTPRLVVGLLSLEAALYLPAVSPLSALPYLQAAGSLLPGDAHHQLAAALHEDRAVAVAGMFNRLIESLQASDHATTGINTYLKVSLQTWIEVIERRDSSRSSAARLEGLRLHYQALLDRATRWVMSVPGTLSLGPVAHAGLRTAVTGDLEQSDRVEGGAWQSVTFHAEPGALDELDVRRGATQARMPSPTRLEVRTQVSREDARRGLWVRAYDRSRQMLALGEFEDDPEQAFGLRATLDIPSDPELSPVEIDLTRKPTEPSSPSASHHFRSVRERGRDALRLERLGELDDASRVWQEVAAHWRELQAPEGAREALVRAASCLRRRGHSAEQISRQLLERSPWIRGSDFAPPDSLIQDERDVGPDPEPPLLAELPYRRLMEDA